MSFLVCKDDWNNCQKRKNQCKTSCNVCQGKGNNYLTIIKNLDINEHSFVRVTSFAPF